MTARTGQRRANQIIVLKKYVLNHLYREDADDDDPFFFDEKYDDE